MTYQKCLQNAKKGTSINHMWVLDIWPPFTSMSSFPMKLDLEKLFWYEKVRFPLKYLLFFNVDVLF